MYAVFGVNQNEPVCAVNGAEIFVGDLSIFFTFFFVGLAADSCNDRNASMFSVYAKVGLLARAAECLTQGKKLEETIFVLAQQSKRFHGRQRYFRQNRQKHILSRIHFVTTT